MGVKTNILLGGLAVAGIGLGTSALVMAFLNQPARQVTGTLTTTNTESVAGYKLDADAGEHAIILTHLMDGGNALVTWHCGKMMTGARHDYTGTFREMSGALVFDEDPAELKAIALRFLVESMIGYGRDHPAPAALTNTVIEQRWFDWEQFPEASFEATTFLPIDLEAAETIASDLEDANVLIQGVFSLNGITAEMSVPAVVTIAGNQVHLEARLNFNRHDFGVSGTNLPGTTVDDDVTIHCIIKGSTDPSSAMAMLADQLQAQTEVAIRQADEIQVLQNQIALMADQIATLDRRVAQTGSGQVIDVEDLAETLEITDPVTLQTYEMILVPGDSAAGINPFYMMKYEVTWDQFKTFGLSEDLMDDPEEFNRLNTIDLRPSRGYGDMAKGMNFGQHPALAMSRLNAERFVDWLNERSDKRFRIPTESEWELALRLGGNDPSATEPPEDIRQIAITGFEFESAPVGSREPNALGIHDMLGNVAEWVTGTGAERVVRGGSFDDDLVFGAWRQIEDQNVWNAGYPQAPVTKWWYVDAIHVGLRLVCDP